jgi:hypothetical protein
MGFPVSMGGDMAGLSFPEAFEKFPNFTEFVYVLWVKERCTGVFREYLDYIFERLKIPAEKEAHRERCKQFVADKDKKGLAPYMRKYK